MSPRMLLRMEGLVILAGSAFAYHALGGRWIWFGVLFFAPDAAMIGYGFGPRVGAVVYNLAHTYLVPIAVLVAGLVSDRRRMILISWIWIAHIGFDRLLGYGLKYGTRFKNTHLSRV